MITKITGEQPFQVLTNNFSISPSLEGYTLQISADGKQYSNLFTVGAGVTRLVTGVAANSYYRLAGNQSQVSINWMKVCVTEGGGGAGNELIPQESLPETADQGTVVALTSGGVYQFDGSEWVDVSSNVDLSAYTPTSGFSTINGSAITTGDNLIIDGGGEKVVELTQAQYDALSGYAEDTTYIITDAVAINMDDYATTAETSALSADIATISGSVATKADAVNVQTPASNNWFPTWNSQGIITGHRNTYNPSSYINGKRKDFVDTNGNGAVTIYGPESAGSAGQPVLSNGSGAPVWGSKAFAFISQTDYDNLPTKDANTIYFITGD